MVSAAHEPHDHTNHGAIRVSNALAPDYLWVALGAPHEQAFVEEVTPGLFNIGVIRMSGYIHVTDLAAAHVLALKLLEGDIPAARSISAPATVFRCAKSSPRSRPRPAAKSRMSSSRGDQAIQPIWSPIPSPARATLNFRPAHSDLATIIRTAWAWHKKAHPLKTGGPIEPSRPRTS